MNKYGGQVHLDFKISYGCYAESPEYFILGINRPDECILWQKIGCLIHIIGKFKSCPMFVITFSCCTQYYSCRQDSSIGLSMSLTFMSVLETPMR